MLDLNTPFNYSNLFSSTPQSMLFPQTSYTPPVSSAGAQQSALPPASVYGGGMGLGGLLSLLSGGGQGLIGRPGRQLNINGEERTSNLTSNEDWARMFNNTGVLGGTMQSSVAPGTNPGLAQNAAMIAQRRGAPMATTLFNMATRRPSQTNPTYMF